MFKVEENKAFRPVFDHVVNTYDQVIGSGAATLVIQDDSIVLEEYFGTQSKREDARSIQADTQFHVASVRKSYIGFAAAYAVYNGYIESIDEFVVDHLPEEDRELWGETTIRHLLTHTHGLTDKAEEPMRLHEPGKEWRYEGIGLKALTRIIEKTTGSTVSEILHQQVFEPLHMTQSDWYRELGPTNADVILRTPGDTDWQPSQSTKGDDKNMYVSARELALWGYLHLKEGRMNGKQIVPKELIQLATTLQSPEELGDNFPRNGYLWFVQAQPSSATEIGSQVPKGSFQILGYTGVTLLVIPEENVVAVRMFNSFGSPEGYDYLEDVRSFGDTVMQCVKKGDRHAIL
ncbi:serine hydrolase domain-containing protein [Halobacillus salinus]|uniref:Class A beta-lactamase-related serine hydrolase n=1 Tax=Halobacillus salinus TaxID=192814 RepID=A0A4Z0GVW4_9BACI|nr:serine hydrolase domain-containing protein [Halobacillus salinus]TGB01398.1 class A beta-lactamase-related serine hydrolase [Halobacillus salinus]